MTTAQDKRTQRTDLIAKGYSWSYLKDWQPKVDMWWHRDWLNNEGVMVKPAGTKVPNQAGNPSSQMYLSSIGLLPWEPGENCLSRPTANGLHGCKGCRERDAAPVFEPETDREPPTAENTVDLIRDCSGPHQYRGKELGARCKIPGCSAIRRQAWAPHKKKAAVTMAEAAPNIGQSRGMRTRKRS